MATLPHGPVGIGCAGEPEAIEESDAVEEIVARVKDVGEGGVT